MPMPTTTAATAVIGPSSSSSSTAAPNTEQEYLLDLNTLEIFRVDSDTALLTESDLAQYWHLVEAADRKELEQFIKHQVFE